MESSCNVDIQTDYLAVQLKAACLLRLRRPLDLPLLFFIPETRLLLVVHIRYN
jgi:hypothetical protein